MLFRSCRRGVERPRPVAAVSVARRSAREADGRVRFESSRHVHSVAACACGKLGAGLASRGGTRSLVAHGGHPRLIAGDSSHETARLACRERRAPSHMVDVAGVTHFHRMPPVAGQLLALPCQEDSRDHDNCQAVRRSITASSDPEQLPLSSLSPLPWRPRARARRLRPSSHRRSLPRRPPCRRP